MTSTTYTNTLNYYKYKKMAYVSQERKKELAPKIKEVLKKYWMKWTIWVRHYSTLVVNISSWKIDFSKYMIDREYIQVNEYYIHENYEWEAKDFLLELKQAMIVWNRDNSDAMTDYFDVGWYIDINIWSYDKPYRLENNS